MALVVVYQQALARVRRIAAAGVTVAWDRLGAYNVEDVPTFVGAVVPVVEGAQRQAAALTLGYMTRRGAQASVDVAAVVAATRGGIPTADVYRRPFVTTWTALKDGRPWADAVRAGRERATSSAEMDVALATRDTAAAVVEGDDRIVGWERIPDGGACEFCLLASTQRYHSGDLMPLHNRCGCSVEPVFGDRDPGHVLKPEQLEALKVGDVDEARRLASERLAVHEHGELGPVLTERGQDFTGPSDI